MKAEFRDHWKPTGDWPNERTLHWRALEAHMARQSTSATYLESMAVDTFGSGMIFRGLNRGVNR
jgi:hypothetical protein